MIKNIGKGDLEIIGYNNFLTGLPHESQGGNRNTTFDQEQSGLYPDKLIVKRFLQGTEPAERSAANSTADAGSTLFHKTLTMNIIIISVAGTILIISALILAFYFIRRKIRKMKQIRRHQRRYREQKSHKSKQKFRVKQVLNEMKH